MSTPGEIRIKDQSGKLLAKFGRQYDGYIYDGIPGLGADLKKLISKKRSAKYNEQLLNGTISSLCFDISRISGEGFSPIVRCDLEDKLGSVYLYTLYPSQEGLKLKVECGLDSPLFDDLIDNFSPKKAAKLEEKLNDEAFENSDSEPVRVEAITLGDLFAKLGLEGLE
jgi:hypothetical protein